MDRKHRAAPLRVLVVDDCPDTTWSLTLLLRAWGHDTCIAADGPSALVQVDAFLPDVVLLDIGLPGMSGFEVADRLSLRPIAARPVIIAVSGYSRGEDSRRALEAGCACYLVKPVAPEELRQILEQVKKGGTQARPQEIIARGVSPFLPGG